VGISCTALHRTAAPRSWSWDLNVRPPELDRGATAGASGDGNERREPRGRRGACELTATAPGTRSPHGPPTHGSTAAYPVRYPAIPGSIYMLWRYPSSWAIAPSQGISLSSEHGSFSKLGNSDAFRELHYLKARCVCGKGNACTVRWGISVGTRTKPNQSRRFPSFLHFVRVLSLLSHLEGERTSRHGHIALGHIYGSSPCTCMHK
jgi:hypothetical protein